MRLGTSAIFRRPGSYACLCPRREAPCGTRVGLQEAKREKVGGAGSSAAERLARAL